MAGAMRTKRGVKPAVPDTLIVYRGKLIALEMKSPGGRCSEAHRAFRERLLQARAQWWVCRSANAAMWALGKSGVRLRMIIEEDGREKRWKQPRLAAWEVPRRDLSEPRPNALRYSHSDRPHGGDGESVNARERRRDGAMPGLTNTCSPKPGWRASQVEC